MTAAAPAPAPAPAAAAAGSRRSPESSSQHIHR